MRRPWLVLIFVCVAAALGGILAARLEVQRRETREREREAVEVRKSEERALENGRRLAARMAASDRVTIRVLEGDDDRRISVVDPEWIATFAQGVGGSSWQRAGAGFWVSTPLVEMYSGEEERATLMFLGDAVHAYTSEEGCRHLVCRNPAMTQALRRMIEVRVIAAE